MILTFPNLDTLRLALTSGAVPSATAQTEAQAGFDEQGRLWLQTPATFRGSAMTELRRLGVESVRKPPPVPLDLTVCSWLQLLPVQRGSGRLDPPEQTPVLFDLPAEQFSSMVTEMLRLGNDRQGFRHLEEGPGGPARVLLRVIGPPYYTLLRALDHNGRGPTPTAFTETGPRVWLQIGHTHPLAGQIKAPP